VLTDDELMAMLEDALAPEHAVPPTALAAARSAFSWRLPEDKVADLLFDSADYPVPAGMRNGTSAGPRQLSYQSDELLIECEVGAGVLVGQLLPPTPVTLELVTAGGNRRRVEVDNRGRFVVRPLPSGPIRLHCGQDQQREVFTPWLLV
jgi:hypothetical protein